MIGDRVAVFIDGSNFYFGLKRNAFPTRVDYYLLGLALAGPDRILHRIYYYNSTYNPQMLAPVEKCDGGRSKSVTPPASHTPFGVWSLVIFVNPSCRCA